MTFDFVTRDEVKALVTEEVARILAGRANPTDLLDVTAAARRLGISVSTLYKKSSKGIVPSVKEDGRLLFEPLALDAYVARNRRSVQRVTDLAAAARVGQ